MKMVNHPKRPIVDELYPIWYYNPTVIQLANLPYPHPYFTDKSHLGESIQQLQLYHPLYSCFFELNEQNYNRIGLNHRYQLRDLHTIVDTRGPLITEGETTVPQEVFIKFSPLLDPIKYMVGKYDIDDIRLKTLPSNTSTTEHCHEKILNTSNASYVDAFFYYLSSVLKNHHQFVHGIDFYGSYLGVQDRYKMNVEEDLEYLTSSSFFTSNVGKLMVLENYRNDDASPFGNASSRGLRKKVHIETDATLSLLDLGIVNIGEEKDEEEEDNTIHEENSGNNMDLQLVYHKVDTMMSTHSDSGSSSSSSDSDEEEDDESSDQASNATTDTEDYIREKKDTLVTQQPRPVEEEEKGEEEEEGWETEEDSSESSSSESLETMVYIFDFPVQMICLEKCANTLDHLFVEGISDEESASALFQVVMILLVYQKMFRFTHNDLHTNNIMYVETSEAFITYEFQGVVYRVPTYGRIFKLIDYGRSIYTYQQRIFCSDSFAPSGDAATQYNCEPFFKSSKPRLEPSMSFDLCRLGCSIYDFVFDDEDITKNEQMKNKSELQRTIQRWCTDDAGKNVLYKKNGEERYPGFRLYKMIARTVRAHTPENQLQDPWFRQFRLDADKVEDAKENDMIYMNIDLYPSYVGSSKM